MKAFVKGLGVGALIGTAAALLFAPNSGKQTRENLKSEVKTLEQLQSDFVRDRERVEQSIAEVRNLSAALIPPFVAGMEKAVQDFQFQTEPRVTQMKEQLERINKTASGLDK